MAESSTVFVAHLTGLPVLDPAGERFGRLADLVAAPRAESAPVVGAVVRVRRRPIFVSAGRLAAVDRRGLRLATSSVNLRRFERRDGEVLVIGELLDREAGIAGSDERVRIFDVGLNRDGGGWQLACADVAPAGGVLLRRRGHRIVPWQELTGLAPAGTSGAARAAALADLPAVELAGVILELSYADGAQLLAALDDERAADVLEELPEEAQVRLIETLGRERAGDVLDVMHPDDAADLLGDLPLPVRTALLGEMEPKEAAPVRRLLQHARDTAGGLMTSNPVLVGPAATVAEALARLRQEEVPRALASQVFVVRPPLETPTGRLLGTVSVQRLLRELPSSLAASHLDPPLDALDPGLPGGAAAEHLAAYNLLVAPVCDEAGRLLGAVSIDDVVDFLLPADWRSHIHPQKGPAA